MQKVSAGCVIRGCSFGGPRFLMLACRLLSIARRPMLFGEHAGRHELCYFLFLLFFGLGGQFASG